MVAEVSAQPKKPQLSTGNRFSEVTRSTVRRMYVVSGHSPAQIAFALSLKPQQVRNLVAKEGWAKLKVANGESRKQQINEKLAARAQDDQNRVVEASAVLAEELQLRTLGECVGILDDTAGKDREKRLQMASGAARNFVQMSTMLRNPVGRSDPGQLGNTTNLIFVGALERAAPKQERNVTEVSAKPVPDSPTLT